MKKDKKEESRKEDLRVDLAKKERLMIAFKESYQVLGREFPISLLEQSNALLSVLQALSNGNEEDENGKPLNKHLNIYTNGTGSGNVVMITREINVGASPFVIHHKESGEMLKSLCYVVPQDIEPTHEWYKPCLEEHQLLSMELREHVSKGGLMLRKIGDNFENSFKQQVKKLTNKKLSQN